jgi:hypothetical protein
MLSIMRAQREQARVASQVLGKAGWAVMLLCGRVLAVFLRAVRWGGRR